MTADFGAAHLKHDVRRAKFEQPHAPHAQSSARTSPGVLPLNIGAFGAVFTGDCAAFVKDAPPPNNGGRDADAGAFGVRAASASAALPSSTITLIVSPSTLAPSNFLINAFASLALTLSTNACPPGGFGPRPLVPHKPTTTSSFARDKNVLNVAAFAVLVRPVIRTRTLLASSTSAGAADVFAFLLLLVSSPDDDGDDERLGVFFSFLSFFSFFSFFAGVDPIANVVGGGSDECVTKWRRRRLVLELENSRESRMSDSQRAVRHSAARLA